MQPPFSKMRPPQMAPEPLLLPLRSAAGAVPASASVVMAPTTTPAALAVRKWRRDILPPLGTSASNACIEAACASGVSEVDMGLRMRVSSPGPHLPGDGLP
jgi:hypothetical protein